MTVNGIVSRALNKMRKIKKMRAVLGDIYVDESEQLLSQ